MDRDQRLIAFCQQAVRIPSPSGQEREVAQLMKRKMEEYGFDEVIIDKYGSVLGTINGKRPGKTILMDGHIDTVDVIDAPQWKHDPFGGEIVDGVMLKDFLVNFGGHDFTCVDRGFKVNEPVQVVIRPEDVQIVPPSVGMLTGLVREVIFKGVHFEMHVDVEGYEWIIHSTQASQPGELIGMNIGPDEIHIMKRSEV